MRASRAITCHDNVRGSQAQREAQTVQLLKTHSADHSTCCDATKYTYANICYNNRRPQNKLHPVGCHKSGSGAAMCRLTKMVAGLVEHEEVVRDHDEDREGHPSFLPSRENADLSQSLGSLQPQRPLHHIPTAALRKY